MPITQDPNPYFAGYNAHKAAKLELEGLQKENEYKSLLMAEYQRKAAAEAAAAPFEAQKRQTEQLLREQELKQRQMETLQKDAAWTAQNILPLLQEFKNGMRSEEQLMQSVREIVTRSDLGIEPQQLEQILAQGPQAVERVVQASMSVLDQMKPPPAPPKPYAMQVGDQMRYFDATTHQQIPGLGGPKFAPQRPPQPKTQFKFDDQGNPLVVSKVNPDGSFVIEKFPSDSDQRLNEPLPERNISAIEKAAKLGVGPYNAIAEVYSNTVGALTGQKSNRDRDDARAWIRRARQTTAAINGVPGRPTNYQVEMATSYLADTKAFKHIDTGVANIIQAVQALEAGYQEAIANYEAAPSKTVAGKYYEEANDIRAALRVLATPVSISSGKRPALSSFDKR